MFLNLSFCVRTLLAQLIGSGYNRSSNGLYVREVKELLDFLHTRGELADGTSIDYAFGLFLSERRGLSVVAHGGAWVGYRAELVRFPEPDLSVIVLANQSVSNPAALALSVADLCLADVYTEEK